MANKLHPLLLSKHGVKSASGADAREKSGGNYSWKSHLALDNVFDYVAQAEFISFLGKALY